MLDAAREVADSVSTHSRPDLDLNHIWAMGIVKCIEIIGEAAVRVSEETRARFPDVPWYVLAGIRNRLVHAYFDVDLDQIWTAATKDLPPLIVQLESIVSSLPTDPSQE
jgi:uncharacterized protein with HEPN domain